MKMTNHIISRMSQRNINKIQLNFIIEYGTKVKDGFLFTIKNAQEAAADNPSFEDQIMRCINVVVIALDELVITVMRANKRKINYLTRC